MIMMTVASFSEFFEQFKWRTFGPHLLNMVLQIALYSVLFWLINRIIVFLIDRSFGTYMKNRRINQKRAETLHTLVRNTTRYIVVFFFLYTILSVLGFPIGTLIASAGIVTVVVGLGAQGIIRDVIAGFLILMEQQMEVGDNVIINGTTSGRVVAFGLRLTTIKDADGGLNYITNSSITTITNQSRTNMRVQIDLPLKADTATNQAIKTVKAVNDRLLPKHPEVVGRAVIQGPTILPKTHLLAISVTMYVKNGDQSNVRSTFTTSYLNALHQEGIELP
ncbi:mechanosensitive ion channel family protein [Furfurilactobacillus cerevisiae]|nr:Potassium efflux system KefA protein - Small-conductance mechanosensitive channel [Furfurilactobacillus rossiae]QLE68066.1 Potassium efflux system KefA protein - Small-conductance mechanosensitive channel [Furfurilactobacillus rossiae]